MNMIFHPADNNGLAFEIGEDAAKVTMQLFAQRFVAQERPSVFVVKTVCTRILARDCGTDRMMRDATA